MGYTYSFMDNGEYGATHVNHIIRRLATKGVSLEYEDILDDGVPYTPAKLNELTNLLATEGVLKDSCKVIPHDSSKVKVTSGIIILLNGSVIEVDGEGVLLTFQPGVKNYVFARTEAVLNKNTLNCTTEPPLAGDAPLAEIEADGSVTDKREYSRANVGVHGSNLSKTISIPPFNYTTDGLIYESDFDITKYNFVFVNYMGRKYEFNHSWYRDFAIFDIQNGINADMRSQYMGDSSDPRPPRTYVTIITGGSSSVNITKTDGKITMIGKGSMQETGFFIITFC